MDGRQTGKTVRTNRSGRGEIEKTTTYDPKTGNMTAQSTTDRDGNVSITHYAGNCSQFGGPDCHKTSETIRLTPRPEKSPSPSMTRPAVRSSPRRLLTPPASARNARKSWKSFRPGISRRNLQPANRTLSPTGEPDRRQDRSRQRQGCLE